MESYWHKENITSIKCMYVPGNANRFLRLLSTCNNAQRTFA